MGFISRMIEPNDGYEASALSNESQIAGKQNVNDKINSLSRLRLRASRASAMESVFVEGGAKLSRSYRTLLESDSCIEDQYPFASFSF